MKWGLGLGVQGLGISCLMMEANGKEDKHEMEVGLIWRVMGIVARIGPKSLPRSWLI